MRMTAGIAAVLLLLAAPGPLLAAETRPAAAEQVPTVTTTKADLLDKLFADLKAEKSLQSAKNIEAAIWDLWMESGDPQVDKLMGDTLAAMNSQSFDLAVDFLDAIVKLKPDYAEGWNKRATVYWLLDDFDKSIADIERTLALEPRHFGALSGLGMIMTSLGEKHKALAAYRRALEVDPHLEGVKDGIARLEKELGKDI
jgi:tetratricopeptide (TPR) repeat protein